MTSITKHYTPFFVGSPSVVQWRHQHAAFVRTANRCYSTRRIVRCSMKPYLEKLVAMQNLTTNEATEAVSYILNGEASDSEIAAFLAVLAAKGETSDEVFGTVKAMRHEMVPVSSKYPVLDIVGTGGDGFNTVNISTAASILAAAAGCRVAKHGNRSVSSKSGSADVLEELGINIQLSPEGVSQCIDQAGIGFMFARLHHPKMRFVGPVRQALKIRTLFNIIGPLLNPCGAEYAVIGVARPSLLDTMADVLISSGVKHGVVVHTAGLDEYSNTGVSSVVEFINGVKETKTFDPEIELGMPRVHVSALKGGDAVENASIIRDVLSGKLKGPISDAIVLNAAVGCYVYGLDPSIRGAMGRVNEAISSGKATAVLEKWAAVSQSTK